MNEGLSTPTSETTIETRPYLADPQVLDKMLRGAARESVNCRSAVGQGILTHEDANKIDEKEATNAARALLGRDKRYAIDTTWNAPGVIDVFMAKELHVQVRGPENILIAGITQFLNEIHQKLDLLKNPTPAPDWEMKVQPTIEKYRNVLLGLPLVAPAEEKTPGVPDYIAEALATRTSAQKVAPAKPVAPKADVPPQPVSASSEKKGNFKWVAVAAVLVVVGLAAAVALRKPVASTEQTKQPSVAPKTEAKTDQKPEAKSPTASTSKQAIPATAISAKSVRTFFVKDGSIVEVDAQGTPGKLIRLITQNINIVRLLDSNSTGTRFLAATESDGPSNVGMNSVYRLWLLDDSGKERLVNESVLSAKFSPDGSKFVYVTSDAALEIEGIDGKKGLELIGAYGATWNPQNGALVFLKVPDGRPVSPESLDLATLDEKTQSVQVLAAGSFDSVTPQCDPSGKFAFVVSGLGTGLPSFWRVSLQGGEPVQITNVRMNEGESWVPTTYQTASWSRDGRWFLFDYRDAPLEQVWGLHVDEKGSLKKAVKLADGLRPCILDDKTFIYLKGSGDKVEAALEKIPAS